MVTPHEGSREGFKIPTFDGANKSWREFNAKFQARAACTGTAAAYKLLSEDARRTLSDVDRPKRLQLESKAYCELLFACKEVAFFVVEGVVEGDDRAARAWALLVDKYQVKSASRGLEMRRQYANLVMAAD
jgi:hypothetical protein